MGIKRIAPNNQYPPTHFIEVWMGDFSKNYYIEKCESIEFLHSRTKIKQHLGKTICVFKIRPNHTPTKHNFNK